MGATCLTEGVGKEGQGFEDEARSSATGSQHVDGVQKDAVSIASSHQSRLTMDVDGVGHTVLSLCIFPTRRGKRSGYQSYLLAARGWLALEGIWIRKVNKASVIGAVHLGFYR
jgi:hypothetical protein